MLAAEVVEDVLRRSLGLSGPGQGAEVVAKMSSLASQVQGQKRRVEYKVSSVF